MEEVSAFNMQKNCYGWVDLYHNGFLVGSFKDAGEAEERRQELLGTFPAVAGGNGAAVRLCE